MGTRSFLFSRERGKAGGHEPQHYFPFRATYYLFSLPAAMSDHGTISPSVPLLVNE